MSAEALENEASSCPEPPPGMFNEAMETKWNKPFEAIAEGLKPGLHRWTRSPTSLICFEPDESAYFKVKAKRLHDINDLPALAWGKDDDFILDFGIHMVGSPSFYLKHQGSAMDAPCRLRLTFGESPLDVTMRMDDVKTWISTSWLPDEVINIDLCPERVNLSRRYSFRFMRVQVVDTSPKYKVKFSDVQCECASAVAPDCTIENITFSEPILNDIDRVSLFTLRDCMQTVFEDGPRRDRRLWIGDLRVQALTNYCTFKDYNLVKRCLYLFAAVPRVDGSIPACVFEKPSLQPSTDYIVDYDALFASTVHDYVVASGDIETGHTLWDTVQNCLRRPLTFLDSKTDMFNTSLRNDSWVFLDWAQNLEHTAGAHGVLLYALKSANALATLLQKAQPYTEQIARMTKAATKFIDHKHNTFISRSIDDTDTSSPPQISYASAAWLVLSRAFSPSVSAPLLLNTLSHPNAIKPLTPYLWHHVADALISVDCYQESLDLIKSYWGGMIRAGADTFWEAYDPNDCMASPYGDTRNNSFCHAWSCSGAYLLRGELRTFVGGMVEGNVRMTVLDEAWVERTQRALE